MGKKAKSNSGESKLDIDFSEIIEIRTRDITEEEFNNLKTIKDSNLYPLYEINNISKVSGLSANKVLRILSDYSYLNKKFIKAPIPKKKKKKNE